MARKPYALMMVNGEEYKLKITAAASMDAEKRLGKGLLEAGGDLRSITTQVTILWAALQAYHHGMSLSAATDLFDEYMDSEDGCTENFINLMNEVMEVSGFTRTAKPDKKPVKAAELNQ